MKLDKSQMYTSFMARIYEEDYSDFDLMALISRLENRSFKLLVCKHSKDNAKTHYHILGIRDNRFSCHLLNEIGFKDSELSDCGNRKGSYFYIKEHKGIKDDKKQEDKEKNHQIEIVYDTIEYKNSPKTNEKASLEHFFECVNDLLNRMPYLSKWALLRQLQSINESYFGYYLKYHQFIFEMYGQALYEMPCNTTDKCNED